MAISAADGRVLWITSLDSVGAGGLGLIDAGPVVVVYGKTALAGLSAETGALKWTIRLHRFGYATFARDDRGRIYAGTDEGKLLVVEPVSGKLLLTFDLNAIPEAADAPKVNYGDRTKSSNLGVAGCPAVLGNTVYLLSQSGFAVALRMSEFMGDSE